MERCLTQVWVNVILKRKGVSRFLGWIFCEDFRESKISYFASEFKNILRYEFCIFLLWFCLFLPTKCNIRGASIFPDVKNSTLYVIRNYSTHGVRCVCVCVCGCKCVCVCVCVCVCECVCECECECECVCVYVCANSFVCQLPK